MALHTYVYDVQNVTKGCPNDGYKQEQTKQCMFCYSKYIILIWFVTLGAYYSLVHTGTV